MNDSGPLPVLLALQVKELSGCVWKINGRTYRLAAYGGKEFHRGREGVNIGLFDEQGILTAYLKSFMGIALSPKRVARTEWLIEQDLASWGPELRGAPKQWLDTRVDGRPEGLDFDFMCYLMDVVPGEDWSKLKERIAEGEEVDLSDHFRWRCVQNLLRAQIILERNGIIHGDISPNNVKVDLSAGKQDPAAYLVDFDAFVAPAAGELGKLTTEEGGVFGTEGYCPPDLHAEGNARGEVAPYSDRYGRDMLVLELLCYDRKLPHDVPPSMWPTNVLLDRLQQIGVSQAVPYLTRRDLFQLPEFERPSAVKLAEEFGMNVPPPIKRRGQPTATPASLKNTEQRQGQLLAKVLNAALIVLWFLCSAQWVIISYNASGWLLPVSVIATAGLIPFALRLFVGGGLLLAGMYGLTWLVFAGPKPQTWEIAGFDLELPARPPTGRSELGERGMTALQLAVVLAALCAVVAVIVRFRY